MADIKSYQDIQQTDQSDKGLLAHVGLVKRVALHLKGRLPNFMELDELIQVGMIGLIEANNSFNGDKGVDFEVFAKNRIRGAILDQVRKMSYLPRSAIVNLRDHNEASSALSGELGREPTQTELAAFMGKDVDEFQRERNHAHRFQTVSLESQLPENTEQPATHSSEPEEQVAKEEFMDSLPPEQKQSFLQMLMEKPLEAFNIVVNALKNKINGEEEEGFVPDKYISYDSQGNATIGQRSIAKSSGPATDFRGTDLYSDYRSYPDTVRGRDNIKRRIDMDMGQPVVPRRIVDGGEYEDYNDPENDAIFDRGKLERGRFQSQDRTAKMIGREELKKRMMDSYYDENRPPNFGRLESDARRGVLNKLDR